MATRNVKHFDHYVVIDSQNQARVLKFLSKVEYHTNIPAKSISKHFSRYKVPYQRDGYTIYKTQNVDLKSFNKGNSDNWSI